jgi:hypothetical protein
MTLLESDIEMGNRDRESTLVQTQKNLLESQANFKFVQRRRFPISIPDFNVRFKGPGGSCLRECEGSNYVTS